VYFIHCRTAGYVSVPALVTLHGPPQPAPIPREVANAWGWGCPGPPGCSAPGWEEGMGPGTGTTLLLCGTQMLNCLKTKNAILVSMIIEKKKKHFD